MINDEGSIEVVLFGPDPDTSRLLMMLERWNPSMEPIHPPDVAPRQLIVGYQDDPNGRGDRDSPRRPAG